MLSKACIYSYLYIRHLTSLQNPAHAGRAYARRKNPTQRVKCLVYPVQRCAGCREVAALGRSLAAVGGRLEALLVAAAGQGPDQEALTSATILTGLPSPSPTWGCVIYI